MYAKVVKNKIKKLNNFTTEEKKIAVILNG